MTKLLASSIATILTAVIAFSIAFPWHVNDAIQKAIPTTTTKVKDTKAKAQKKTTTKKKATTCPSVKLVNPLTTTTTTTTTTEQKPLTNAEIIKGYNDTKQKYSLFFQKALEIEQELVEHK